MDNNSQEKNNSPSPESGGNPDNDTKEKPHASAYDSESDIVWERKSSSKSSENGGNSKRRVIRTESGTTGKHTSANPEPDPFDKTVVYNAATKTDKNSNVYDARERTDKNPESARIPVQRTKIQSSLPYTSQSRISREAGGSSKSSDRMTPVPYETRQIKKVPDSGNESKQDDESASFNTGTKIVRVRRESLPDPQIKAVIPAATEEAVDISSKENNRKEKRSALKASAKKRRKESGEGAATVLSVVWAIMYIVLIVITGIFLGLGVVFVGNDVFAFVKEDIIIDVEIPEYATLNEVTEIFYEEGLIKYKLIFKMWANLRDKDNAPEFLAGSYKLTPTMNYDELRAEIRPKYTRSSVRITIPEGYTTDEIIDLFVTHGISTKEEFVNTINNYDFNGVGYEYWFLDELELNGYSPDRFYRLDGYLFPDTYEFFSDSSASAVIAKLLDNFKIKFNSTYAERASELGMTIDEIVTLASLIEKEARLITDFPRVSSVFHNRLKNSAAFPTLDSDATIIYAMHHNTGVRPTSLTGEDTSYQSPYNSYRNQGLPPGAIANPGLEAIKYALYPEETNFYYFVSDKYGEVYYASTKAEQDRNIIYARSVE